MRYRSPVSGFAKSTTPSLGQSHFWPFLARSCTFGKEYGVQVAKRLSEPPNGFITREDIQNLGFGVGRDGSVICCSTRTHLSHFPAPPPPQPTLTPQPGAVVGVGRGRWQRGIWATNNLTRPAHPAPLFLSAGYYFNMDWNGDTLAYPHLKTDSLLYSAVHPPKVGQYV